MNFHSVTRLSRTNKQKKETLLDHEIIFCNQITEDKKIVKRTGIYPLHVNHIYKEAVDISHQQSLNVWNSI